MQPSNHGIYIPSDTQEHAGSGRASSMPRLTVDPQVKRNHHLPYAVASWAVLNWWVMNHIWYFQVSPWLPPPLLYKQNLAHGLSLQSLLLHTVFPMKPQPQQPSQPKGRPPDGLNILKTQPAMQEIFSRISPVHFSFFSPFLVPLAHMQLRTHTALCQDCLS